MKWGGFDMPIFGSEIQKLKIALAEKDEKIKQLSDRVEYLENELCKKEFELNDLKKREKNEQSRLEDGGLILYAGKYKGGIDIPIGNYNLYILSGYGRIKTNAAGDNGFWMAADETRQKQYGYTERYNGLEINKKTELKISESAKVRFVLSSPYDYSQEISMANAEYEREKEQLQRRLSDQLCDFVEKRDSIESEIEAIKEELDVLNNETIEKYYVFSDYSHITSQECKNKISVLKSRESKLRDYGNDVDVVDDTNKKKITERSIRQILRNFNADCDNIMSNIGLKNIDMVRNKIQKSYDTLNKLYSIDGVSLSDTLLSIKLEQATLLYTYQLKYQQERDIQQAIKEQMLEEAKAEREIQEQKKRIEKDLQQHLGEINRLMKYIQKTQIDAERQLYMDKIKELEDKIKNLEADKETVLEREANAKAGFVYVISNIGSFGENIYKIGMTRRLEPMERIRELSSASVPFEFDVHAMIFSSDAPDLENTLHRYFADKAVNKVNPRKEFYRVDINEIERIVKENYNDTVRFTKVPIAEEYRQSIELYPDFKRTISENEAKQMLHMDIVIEDD